MGLAGIEPTTYRLGGDRSILLSYSPKRVRSWEFGEIPSVGVAFPKEVEGCLEKVLYLEKPQDRTFRCP